MIKKRIFGKGHQMTRVLQPQRDIDREKEGGGREREKERGRERNMETYNVSNKSAQEARYHDAANDMCYLILLW